MRIARSFPYGGSLSKGSLWWRPPGQRPPPPHQEETWDQRQRHPRKNMGPETETPQRNMGPVGQIGSDIIQTPPHTPWTEWLTDRCKNTTFPKAISYLEFLGMMKASGPIDSNITMLKYREIMSLVRHRNLRDGGTCDRRKIEALPSAAEFYDWPQCAPKIPCNVPSQIYRVVLLPP